MRQRMIAASDLFTRCGLRLVRVQAEAVAQIVLHRSVHVLHHVVQFVTFVRVGLNSTSAVL